MLFTILLIMAGVYSAFHFFAGGFHPLMAIKGALKGTSHFVVGLSVLTILSLILKISIIFKLIAWVLLILSIDIVTPPYGIDIETLFAIPIATRLDSHMSFGWALGLAYLIVFGLAIAYLIFWWFVLRKKL